MSVPLVVEGVFGGGVWFPLVLLHSIYLYRNVAAYGLFVQGERRMMHRLLLLPVFRFACSATYCLGQLLILSRSGEHWLGIIAAFRILSVMIDRFYFYGLCVQAWKGWRSGRAGFSRNESRTVISADCLVVFAGLADLAWMGVEGRGQSGIPFLVFRSTFWMYCLACCHYQHGQISQRIKALNVAGVSGTVAEKVERLGKHLQAHRVLCWFGLGFGGYWVGTGAVVSQRILSVVPWIIWDEAGYLLLYLLLATLCHRQLLI